MIRNTNLQFSFVFAKYYEQKKPLFFECVLMLLQKYNLPLLYFLHTSNCLLFLSYLCITTIIIQTLLPFSNKEGKPKSIIYNWYFFSHPLYPLDLRETTHKISNFFNLKISSVKWLRGHVKVEEWIIVHKKDREVYGEINKTVQI